MARASICGFDVKSHGCAGRCDCRARIAACIGRGLFVALMVFVLMPSPTIGWGAEGPSQLAALRGSAYAGIALFSLAVCLGWRPLYCRGWRRRVLAGACALGVCGGALYAATAMGSVPASLQFAAIALSVSAVCLMGPAWGDVFGHFDQGTAARLTMVGILVAGAMLLAVRVLPAPVPLGIVVALPAISGALLLWSLARLGPLPVAAAGKGDAGPQPSRRFLAGSFFAMASGGFLAGHSEYSQVLTWVSYAVGMLLTFAAIWVVLRLGREVDFARVGLVLVAAMAVGTAALVLLGGRLADILPCLLASTQQCTGIMLWLALLDVVVRTKSNPYMVMPGGLLAVNAGTGFGSLCGMLFLDDLHALAIVALLFALAALYCFATTRRPVEASVDVDRAFEDRLHDFAERYGLTPREVDVLRYWVAGHQIEHVANSLGIGRNTVKSHTLHIYHKTGTSNKAQLRELFEGDWMRA